MELQQLKYLIKVVEEGTVTRAAEKLHVAQPAVSQTIKRLEEFVGVALFERRNRSLILTDAGAELYEFAKIAVEKASEMPQKLQEIAGISRQTVTINLNAASKLITEAIIGFREQNPDVFFKVTQNSHPRNIDIEVSTDVKEEHIEKGFSKKEEILLAVPREWLENEGEETYLSEYKNFDFISLDTSKPYRLICDYICHMGRIEPLIAFKSDSPQSVRDLISAGLGVGFWPEFSWGELNSEKVALLHIKDGPCNRYINVRDLTQREKPAVKMFMEYLERIV